MMFEKERQILQYEFGFELIKQTDKVLSMQKQFYRLYIFENGVCQITKKGVNDAEGKIKFYATNPINNIPFTELLFKCLGVTRDDVFNN